MEGLFEDRRLILAPMAGVTDEVFRELCIEAGAQLTYTEMVSAKALSYGSGKTRDLLVLAPSEKQVAVQIFGHEPETMAQEAYELEQTLGGAVFSFDVNMGCPARKIAGKGDGARSCATLCSQAASSRRWRTRSSIPVTVKMRRGFAYGEETAPELAHIVQESGASAVAVHGRYAQQFYQGDACWETIRRVKDAVKIPVIGNGDITSGVRARAMLTETGCDALMIGRAAEGNPWIFSEIKSYLETGVAAPAPSTDERIEVALRHARMLSERFDDHIVKMRKHAMWYLKGMRGATAARRAINDAVTFNDFATIFHDVAALQKNGEEQA